MVSMGSVVCASHSARCLHTPRCWGFAGTPGLSGCSERGSLSAAMIQSDIVRGFRFRFGGGVLNYGR